jgi:PleD family two-component response regulator
LAGIIAHFNSKAPKAMARGEKTVITMSKVRCKDGTDRWFEFVTELDNSLGKHVRVITMRDVTQLKAAIAEVDKVARTDALTGLLNRHGMNECFDTHHAMALRTGEPFSLILCDIDHFKQVNDLFGHACGDYVIVRMAQQMQKAVRRDDSIAVGVVRNIAF